MEEKRSVPVLSWILAGMSVLYCLGISLRNKGYDKGWFRVHRVKVPVVSIGNISVGGTGKTPLVQMIASELEDLGKIAILTRGFRSEKKRGKILCIDSLSRLSVKECGDEPYLLSQKTKASIWIGADRVLSAKASTEEGAVCLILDDGFQHRRLSRDLEIVAVDSEDPLNSLRFLPYGFLRDHPERLQKADLIVTTNLKDLDQYKALKEKISSYTKAPVVGMSRKFVHPLDLERRKIGVLCGLARPGYFLSALKEAKADIVESCILPDHHTLSKKELQKFASSCKEKGATAIVCTEKDGIKLELQDPLVLPIQPLTIRLEVVAGKKYWDQMMETIKQRIEVHR